MSVVSGYDKYKRYQKVSDDTYKLVSHWTSSNTVHFDDDSTAEEKVGAINTSVSNINTSINTINTSITNINTSINGLDTKVEQLENKLPTYITPQMYGAVADGNTNDTQAVKSALTECLSKGRTLYFPAGIYKITESLKITAHIDIKGDGENTKILGGNFHTLNVTSSCVIKDLVIVGDETSKYAGIYVKDTNYVEIRNIFVTNCYDCIKFDGTCFYCTLTELKFVDCVNSFIRTSGDTEAGHQIILNNITMSVNSGKYSMFLENIGAITMNEIEISPTNSSVACIHFGNFAPLAGVSQFVNCRFEGSLQKCIEMASNTGLYKYLFFSNCYFAGKCEFNDMFHSYFSTCYFTGEDTINIVNGDKLNFVGCEFMIDTSSNVIDITNSNVHIDGGVYTGSSTFINATTSDICVANTELGTADLPVRMNDANGDPDYKRLNLIGYPNSAYSVSKLIEGEAKEGNKIMFNTGMVIPPTNYFGIPIDGNATQLKICNYFTDGGNVGVLCFDTLTSGQKYWFFIYADTK
jgi:hypothetical protein